MQKLLRSLCFAALVGAVGFVQGQALSSERAAAIDRFVQAERERQHIPAVSIAVVREGRPILLKGYGTANLELGVAATPDTVYKIASVSKQFIATAIMLLVQDGKIRLDEEVGAHFQGAPESWKGITIRHLLSHTSGFPRELPGWSALVAYTDEDLAKMALQMQPDLKPGEQYRYCNSGYFMLGLIINRIAGKHWPEFLRERVFAPQGMTATRTTTWEDLVPNRADGYSWKDGTWRNDGALLSVRTSGAFLSTVRDLAKWEAALWRNATLSRESWAQMATPMSLLDGKRSTYGLGWSLSTSNGRQLVSHTGALQGFRSIFQRYIGEGVAVIVLANCDSADTTALANGIAQRVLEAGKGPKQEGRHK